MASRNGVRSRVAKYRVSMRAAGLRPVQIWLPDTKMEGFAAECRRQSLLLRRGRDERDVLRWLAKVADTKDWE